MAPLHALPRTLDVAALAANDMSDRQVALLRRLLTRLASCDLGRRLLHFAIDHRLTLRVGSRRELSTGLKEYGGIYLPDSNLIALLEHGDADWQVKVLAHELQHFVDHMLGWRGGTVQGEVRARQTEAVVIRQLRLRVASWALEPNGEFASPEAIAKRVRAHRLYRFHPEESPRFDGRIHPLLEAHEVLPPSITRSVVPRSSGMRIGGVGPVIVTGPVTAVTPVATGPVTQAAAAAIGSRTPTGWDPEAAALVDTDVERFLSTLDAHRLARGA